MPAQPSIPLLCHPAITCPAAVRAIAAQARFNDQGTLRLRYRLHGQPAGLLIPAPGPAGPADHLWQHCCCEAFVATDDSAPYREFNFSPSGRWACYDFAAYRQRQIGALPASPPQISFQLLADGFQLDAELDPALLPAGATLRIGLSAVIEASDGSKSYWALAHGAAQPDFHLRQSFTLTLPSQQP